MSRKSRNRFSAKIALILTCWTATPLFAQNDECCLVDFSDRVFEEMPILEIAHPGPFARAPVLADDASSAYINPAAMSLLARPSIAVAGAHTGEGSTISPFSAYVYPIKGWSFGLYYAQLADMERSAASERQPVPDSEANLDIAGLGFSMAYLVNERLSLGAGITRFEMNYQARDRFSNEIVLSQTVDNNTEYSAHAGLSLQFNQAWRFSAHWRDGPRFGLEKNLTGPLPTSATAGRGEYRLAPSHGVGLTYKPTWEITLLFQADRLNRSKTLGNSLPVIARDLLGELLLQPPGNFQIDDSTLFRAGFEYTFWDGKYLPFLRLGIGRTHSGGVYFSPFIHDELGEAYRSRFPKEDGDWRYSMGFSMAPAEGSTIEIAAERSMDRTAYSLLILNRF